MKTKDEFSEKRNLNTFRLIFSAVCFFEVNAVVIRYDRIFLFQIFFL